MLSPARLRILILQVLCLTKVVVAEANGLLQAIHRGVDRATESGKRGRLVDVVSWRVFICRDLLLRSTTLHHAVVAEQVVTLVWLLLHPIHAGLRHKMIASGSERSFSAGRSIGRELARSAKSTHALGAGCSPALLISR